MQQRRIWAVLIAGCLFRGVPARAETCIGNVLHFRGTLPLDARSAFEVDAHELQPNDTPTVKVDHPAALGLDLTLRFRRVDKNTWQVDHIPSESGAAAVGIGAMSFGSDGMPVNAIGAEFDPPLGSAHFGDRVYIDLLDLREGERYQAVSIARVETVSTPCYEAPRVVIGPEQLSSPEFAPKMYNEADGLAAMLRDARTENK